MIQQVVEPMTILFNFRQVMYFLAFQAGNHFVWEFYRGKTLNVPASYGLLHHYRVCEFGGNIYRLKPA